MAQTNTALAVKQEADKVRELLERMKPQFKLALPRHLSVDRLCRIVMTSIQKNPKLLECNRISLLASVLQAAQLGLEPDGVLGHGYLVPFAGQVQFQPGYRGLLHLTRQSGTISTIAANVVRKKDYFKPPRTPEDILEHVSFSPEVPDDADDVAMKEGGVPLAQLAGPLTHAWAFAKLKDEGIQQAVMHRVEILAVRGTSQAWRAYVDGKIQAPPWATHAPEMWKKTVLKRLAKLLPQSTEDQRFSRAVQIDDQAEIGETPDLGEVMDQPLIDAEVAEPPKTLKDKVAAAAKGEKKAGAKHVQVVREDGSVVCDGDHPEPPCSDPGCFRRPPEPGSAG